MQRAVRLANGPQPLAARVRHAAHHTPATGCALLQRTALRCKRCNRLQQSAVCCNRRHCVATGCAALQQVRLRHARLRRVATGCCVVVRSAVATRDGLQQRMGNRVGCFSRRANLSAVATRYNAPLRRTIGRWGLASRAIHGMHRRRPTRRGTRRAAACARYSASASVACACTRTRSGMRAVPRL